MRALRYVGFGIAGLLSLLLVILATLQTSPGQALLAGVVSRLASGPEGGLQVRGLSGVFPTDLRVRDLAYADSGGAWLTAEDVRLRWSLPSLLAGRLRIELLSARRVAVLRSPLPSKTVTQESGGSFGLPVGVDLQVLDIGTLHLARDLVGAGSDWSITGAGTMPASLRDLSLNLAAKRTDGPAGALTVDLRADLDRRFIDGKVSMSEGQGGLASAWLARPDLGAFTLELTAKGDERSGTTTLKAAAADAATADGTLEWNTRGDGATTATLRLDAAAPGLPAGPMADILRQPIHVEGEAVLEVAAIELNRLALTSGPHAVTARGRYERAAERATGTVTVRSAEAAAVAALAGGMRWQGLDIEATADIARIATAPKGTIDVTGRSQRLSMAAIEPRLPELGPVDLKARATIDDNRIQIGGLDIATAVARMSGTGTYGMADGAVDARARLVLPDLAAFSALVGRGLGGKASFDLTAGGNRHSYAVGWQGAVDNVQADGLPPAVSTGTIALSGNGRRQADGSWSLRDALVQGDGGRLTVSGQGKDSSGVLDLALDLPRLEALEPSLAGSLRANGKVTLSADRTDARVGLALRNLQRGGLAARSLDVSASGALEAGGAASGSVKVDGDLAAHPVSLEGRFSLDGAGNLQVPTFQGRWASAVLDVSNFAVAGDRATGHARFGMSHLEDAAALATMPLAGSLDAELSADAAEAGRRLTARIEGRSLRVDTVSIASLDLQGTVDRPGPDLSLDATLAADGLAGVSDIGSVRATAKGRLADLALSIQANGAATRATLEAGLSKSADALGIALRRFEGSYRAVPVALAAPGRIMAAGPRITVEPMVLRVGTGRISVRGNLDEGASDLQIEIASLPLQLVDAFAPDAGLEGALQGKIQVRGTTAAPTVDATYSVPALRLRRPEAALLPPVAIQGTASLAGRDATVQARASAGAGTALALKARATLPQGGAPLVASGSVSGNVEIAPFAPLLGNEVRNVTGRLRPDLTVEIAGAKLSGSGSVDLSNATLSLPESGLRLNGGQGRLVLQGNVLQIQRLSFQSAGNGTVSASGTVTLDPEGGIRPELAISSRNAVLVNRPDVVARVSANVRVTGDTASAIDVTGPITVERAEISINAQQSAAFPTIAVREVDRPGASAAQVAAAPAPPKSLQAPPAEMPVRLALTIDAPQAVFVRGRGLDAEMSGQLSVGGTPARPSVTGGLAMRRGDFNLLGRRLTFSKGVVTLDNLDRIDPALDFVANTTVQSTVITVTVQGTARAPSIAMSSVPELPPDEAMALLLFGKPASGLSIFELAQAAQGLAELTGQQSDAGVLGRLRGGLGLDRLSVNSGNGANAPVSVEAGRYVAPGIYVGARQGATGNSSRGVVQVEVLDHVKIEGDIGADSNGRIGIKTEWDY